MMNLKGIQQQQQQQQSGTSMEGAYANTNNHRGPSSASLDATGNEKFTDIIFMEEPAKVRILKNRNFFIERAKTNLDVLQSASLNESNELIKRKLLKQQQQYETKQNNNSFVNNCSPSSDHINSSTLDNHHHHQNLRSRGADSSSSYFKFKPFQPLRFAPPTAALTAATAAAAAAAAAAVSSGEHLANASSQVAASPSLLKTAHNKSISPSPSSLAIHNLNSNSVDVIYNHHHQNNQNNGFPVANSPINNTNSSSMYLSKINYHHQEPPQPPTMTQYKFSKTLFGENATTSNNNHQSNSTTPQQHHNPRSMNNNVLKRASNDNSNSKSPSRNSLNQQHHESIFLNSSSSPLSIGGAVVNSNTNGVKRQLAGSNSLGRSLTMRYVRPQPPTYLIEPTTNGLQQQQQQQRSGSQNQQHLNYNNNNLGLNRRSSFYHQTLDNSSPKRTPISTNTTANNNHTDLIASFSPSISGVGGNGSDHIKRSSSIKLLREKTSLSNYFSGLTNNNTSGSPTNNALTLNFLTSSSSNHNNNNSPSKLSTTAVKKGQPVSFRNNSTNINSLIRKHESNDAAKTNSISLENVMNGFELLLAADDLHSSKTIGNNIAANPPAGIKLVSNNNANLLNRSKRSDEILVIESSPNNNNEQTIEIKELTKTNNRKSVEFGEQQEPITDLNDSAEIYNAKKAILANRQRFNLINNRPNLSNSLLKKTKSFMIADSNGAKLFGQEARNEAESKSILTTNSSSKNNNSPAQNGATTLKLVRSNSRLSNVTRDVNDSYAYTNVHQYIEENELMPPEKAYSIRKWIRHVNQMRDEWEKRTVEINIVDG